MVVCSSGNDLDDDCRDAFDRRLDNVLDDVRFGGSVSQSCDGYFVKDLTELFDNFFDGDRVGGSVSQSCDGYFVKDLTELFDDFFDGVRTVGAVSLSCDGYFVNALTEQCDTPEPCLATEWDFNDRRRC